VVAAVAELVLPEVAEHLILLVPLVAQVYQHFLGILDYQHLMELQDQQQVVGLLVVVEVVQTQHHPQQDHLVVLEAEELGDTKTQEMLEKELLGQLTLVVVAVDVVEIYGQVVLIMVGEVLVDLV
jgi:hypothetical protein